MVCFTAGILWPKAVSACSCSDPDVADFEVEPTHAPLHYAICSLRQRKLLKRVRGQLASDPQIWTRQNGDSWLRFASSGGWETEIMARALQDTQVMTRYMWLRNKPDIPDGFQRIPMLTLAIPARKRAEVIREIARRIQNQEWDIAVQRAGIDLLSQVAQHGLSPFSQLRPGEAYYDVAPREDDSGLYDLSSPAWTNERWKEMAKEVLQAISTGTPSLGDEPIETAEGLATKFKKMKGKTAMHEEELYLNAMAVIAPGLTLDAMPMVGAAAASQYPVSDARGALSSLPAGRIAPPVSSPSGKLSARDIAR